MDQVEDQQRAEQEAELRQRQKELQRVLDCIPAGLATLLPDGRFFAVNRPYCELLGYNRAELLGKSIQEITHSFDQGSGQARFQAALRGEEQEAFERRCVRQDGKMLFCSVRQAAVRELSGRIELVSEVLEDIGDRKKKEEELRDTVERAEERARKDGRLWAEIGHAVRTPLNGVIGMLELLLGTELDEEQRDWGGSALTAAEELLKIITLVQSYANLEARRVAIQRRPFQVKELVTDVFRNLSVVADAKGLSFSLDGSDWVEGEVLGDPDCLRQVLVYFLEDALSYTKQGGIVLYVHTEAEDKQAAQVRFSIADTGEWITPDVKQKLFRPAEQPEDARQRRDRGAGLGFAVCKGLIELMEGEIEVSNEEEAGMTVAFSLPLWKTGTGAGRAAVSTADEEQVAAQFRGRRILLVEDTPLNQRLVIAQLEKLGLQVLGVSNGPAAIEAMGREDVDLVLMDCKMPGLDGYETTREIRQLEMAEMRSWVPIVAMTACSQKDELDRCIEAGMNDYLCKPFKQEELRRIVQLWLGKGDRKRAKGPADSFV